MASARSQKLSGDVGSMRRCSTGSGGEAGHNCLFDRCLNQRASSGAWWRSEAPRDQFTSIGGWSPVCSANNAVTPHGWGI